MTPKKHFKEDIDGLMYSLYLTNCDDFLNDLNTEVDTYLFSPPYNIGSSSPAIINFRKYGGYDSKSYRSIADYPDDLPEDMYQEQQIRVINKCVNTLKPEGVLLYNHKDRHCNGILIDPMLWLSKTNTELVDKVVWNRKTTHNNGRTQLRSVHEYIYVLKRKSNNTKRYYRPAHTKKKELTNPTSVWEIPIPRKSSHNAAFPLTLARSLINLFVPDGGIVCDPYSGSGTTMLAAKLENKAFIGCEILEKYFDSAIKRFKSI